MTLEGYTGYVLASDSFLSNFGDPYFESYIAVPNLDGTFNYLPRTFTFDITSEFTFGTWLDLSARLSGGTGAGGGIDSEAAELTGAAYQSSSAFVDAANSAYWGGISVFTSDGAEVSDYSLESLSGTDWRQSFVPEATAVPEPETYALMLAGLAAVGAAARRRKSA